MYLFRLEVLLAHLGERTMHESIAYCKYYAWSGRPSCLFAHLFFIPQACDPQCWNRNIPRAKTGKINPDSCKWLQAEFHHKQAVK